MTTRAKPDTSWQSACRHFFRHVDNPKELRRHPIAKAFFQSYADCADAERDVAAIQEIHAAILTALGNYELEAFAKGQIERARRRRTIVVSQILGHRPPENVAAELNLSDRQFYRERSAICACIARTLG